MAGLVRGNSRLWVYAKTDVAARFRRGDDELYVSDQVPAKTLSDRR